MSEERKLEWLELKEQAVATAERRQLGDAYMHRLKFEIKEIEKQGANAYWANIYNEHAAYDTNDNGLVFPWLLGLTPIDPLEAEHEIILSTDLPDIDVDCLPEARDKIKAYAAEKYGAEYVCSVGTWLTFKFKSALQSAARGLGADVKDAMIVTKALPDDADNLKDDGYSKCIACGTRHNSGICPKCSSADTDGVTIGQLLDEYSILKEYRESNPEVVDMAVKMVGKIRAMGKHAGGVIITNRQLMGNIPMGISKGTDGEAQWTSMWTEGRNTQLSKFGYVKWDLLGLKTLQYIHDACNLIRKTRGYEFNAIPWRDNDPEDDCVGWYLDDKSTKHKVSMSDEAVFKMINDLRVETVFQFETDVQRGVLSNGVIDYYDLQVFNAMGHPGPMAFIPEYVKRRRDVTEEWRKNEHPDIAAELEDTHGIIVYQEQLQKLWQKFASFTAPEAEKARKAVAKKWVDQLKGIEAQWKRGASKILGEEWAIEMWSRMIAFGRYAFNKSHSCAYILVAYWCAWLKTHFPPEWWASVMSSCHSDRIPKYMNTARLEGVKFGFLNATNLTPSFSVDASLEVTPGLTSIKGIGQKAASKLVSGVEQEYADIDEYVHANGKNKRVMEPLVKLGAFSKWHPNLRATWKWYEYRYCSGKVYTQLRKDIRARLLENEWADKSISEARQEQIDGFKRLHPKRKVPARLLSWEPKAKDTRENVMALFSRDFRLSELLDFEKQYLGYFWHSPLDLFETAGHTIMDVKKSRGGRGKIECIVEKLTIGHTKNDKEMGRLKVTDGLADCTVMLWQKQLKVLKKHLVEGWGITIDVVYDQSRNTFTLARNTAPVPLKRKQI
jgi:DNA polymerase III alpha subunit